MEVSEWKRRIELERENKNNFFGMHFQSPILPEDRQKFRGLGYYPPNPDYRFEIELHEHKEKGVLKIEDTQGNAREFLRWGEFRFKIGDTDCKLQAYKSEPTEERLFVPFRDATSGKETYGAGRYLDLEPGKHYTTGGKWILDFNEAYNPWCVYSENYACPFVPSENWLKVLIRAGEKNYLKNSIKEVE
ncbi:unnamed protein product [marine sediment metagenome]|uniref:DUF1684 domain-containing protein n=1 Tax=marine sediment metagenome TaxID=412755 RepID=X1EEV3_9ZZZZ